MNTDLVLSSRLDEVIFIGLISVCILIFICPLAYHLLGIKYRVRRSQYFQNLFFKDNIRRFKEHAEDYVEYAAYENGRISRDLSDYGKWRLQQKKNYLDFILEEKNRTLDFIREEGIQIR